MFGYGEVQIEQVWEQARRSRQQVLDRAGTEWSEEDSELWQKTLEEVGETLIGPLTQSQVTDQVGTDVWVSARRFSITQKGKVRPIDDFSEFQVKSGPGRT